MVFHFFPERLTERKVSRRQCLNIVETMYSSSTFSLDLAITEIDTELRLVL